MRAHVKSRKRANRIFPSFHIGSLCPRTTLTGGSPPLLSSMEHIFRHHLARTVSARPPMLTRALSELAPYFA